MLDGSLSDHAIVENLRVDVGLGGLTRSRASLSVHVLIKEMLWMQCTLLNKDYTMAILYTIGIHVLI